MPYFKSVFKFQMSCSDLTWQQREGAKKVPPAMVTAGDMPHSSGKDMHSIGDVTWALWRLKSPKTRLFVQLRLTYTSKFGITGPVVGRNHRRPVVSHHNELRGIHRRPVDFPDKGPAMRKVYRLLLYNLHTELNAMDTMTSDARMYPQMAPTEAVSSTPGNLW